MSWAPARPIFCPLGFSVQDARVHQQVLLTSDFNVRSKCGALREILGDVCYVPDGYAVSILVPFPMNDDPCLNLLGFSTR
jgi:hypothetical protein